MYEVVPHSFLVFVNYWVLVNAQNTVSRALYVLTDFSPNFSLITLQGASFQFSPVPQSCLTLWHPMNCSRPGFSVHHQLLELAQTQVHRVSNAIQPSHPLLSPSLPAFNLSQFQSLFQSQVFASGGQDIGASASASAHPINIQDWFPLGLTGLILQTKGLARVFSNTTVQKAPILQCSAFFIVQLSHPYLTTGKTIALTRWTFVGKVISLLFNMLSRLIVAFLPRSKRLLISWLQSPPAVILESQKIKPVTVSIFSPIFLPWSDGTGCHDLHFWNV